MDNILEELGAFGSVRIMALSAIHHRTFNIDVSAVEALYRVIMTLTA